MLYDILFFLKDIVIALLIFALIRAGREIRKLSDALKVENRKRTLPLLTIEVLNDEDYGIFLINESYCHARNITFEDLDVVVDYGFKKHVVLKFDLLDILKPNERHKLRYRVFDDNFDTTLTDGRNILNHLQDSPIELRLRYENMEKAAFRATIVSENGQYLLKEVNSVA